MGEVIDMSAYLERRSAPVPEDIKKRLAEIGIQQLLFASERTRLLSLLFSDGSEVS